jgi:hypothetical protein
MMSEIEFITHSDITEYFNSCIEKEPWIVVHYSFSEHNQDGGYYIALVPIENCDHALQNDAFDFMVGQNKIIDGVEPIVLLRSFHGLKQSYLELNEEFRLFHNLYCDQKTNQYLKIRDDGTDEVIAKINQDQDKVEIRLQSLREYAASKGLLVVYYIDSVRYSGIELNSIPKDSQDIKITNNKMNYYMRVMEGNHIRKDRVNIFSRFLGKRVIEPIEKTKNGISNQYEEYIIDVDSDGLPIEYSCDPDKLSDYFGKNPNAPNFITPVFFRKEVLSKYYSNPDVYLVSDGSLHCGNLWMLYIDNDNSDYVVVYLGYLGERLPYMEQKYWKSFNIPPEGVVSTTCFKRSIMGIPSDPESPDLLFKYKLEEFNKKWSAKYQWPLFKRLMPDDRHHLISLHIPGTNDQAEFDSQVMF